MLTNILLTSLWCLGFYKAFDDNMVFSFIRKYLISYRWSSPEFKPKYVHWIWKPIFDCPPCMASLHGFIAFFIFYGTIDFRVIPFIFCVSGLNWLLSSIAE